MDKVIGHLSKSGNAIVKAYNREAQLKTRVGQTVALSFNEIQSPSSIAADKTNANSLLDNLSSHIRVQYPDGSINEFTLTLRKARNGGRVAANQIAANKTSTWIALDPERFYVKENDQGNEIYPVTFLATSMKNPDVKVEVTLHRNGILTWPSENTSNFSSNTAANMAASSQRQMMYVTAVPVMTSYMIEPCIEPGPPECGNPPPPPPGGGGDDGGGNDEGTVAANELQMGDDDKIPFLAIKTLRFITDENNAKEVNMFVAPAIADVDNNPFTYYSFSRKWNYSFSEKTGRRGFEHTVFGGDGLWNTVKGIIGILKPNYPYVDVKGIINIIFPGGIFNNRNHNTTAADLRVYHVPDVDYEGVEYHFTNMQTWIWSVEPTYGYPPLEMRYVKAGKEDYFPVTALLNTTFRMVLVDDDEEYSHMATLEGNNEDEWIGSFNMQSGTYESTYTIIEAEDVNNLFGASDDIMNDSGVTHIDLQNFNAILGNQNALTLISPSGFKWEFVKVYRSLPIWNPNL